MMIKFVIIGWFHYFQKVCKNTTNYNIQGYAVFNYHISKSADQHIIISAHYQTIPAFL